MAEERVQRRLAAILAADVVGYSRLIEADEVATRVRFNEHLEDVIKPAMDQHRGRLVKTMGDGLLVEFGSVVDAVQCATDIQNGVGGTQAGKADEDKLLFRMGIHLGDVIVEGDDIHGDGVNIAARLEGLADPGGICVSDMVHAGIRNKLSLDFDDLGEKSLKNIAEPVRVYRIESDHVTGVGDVGSSADAIFRRPAVAVLPFENLSGDPEQEYFADGLTEDIITTLSHWRSFPVIARNSTFVFKGKLPDIRQIGIELGVRYVLQGSVRKGGSRVRVSAQLIDAETGHHVWSERYDRDLEDVFALQDELTQRITATVTPELERIEYRRAVEMRPRDLGAWDYFLRGWALLKEFRPEANEAAREMFNNALETDPDYSRAYMGLSVVYVRQMASMVGLEREALSAKALEAGHRAIELDPADSEAHQYLGVAFLWACQHDQAIAEEQWAIELNPSNHGAYVSQGHQLALAGRPLEGIPFLEKGLKLSPQDARAPLFQIFMARSQHIARNYEEAAEWARRAVRTQPHNPHAQLMLAACLGHIGELDSAKAALDACEKLRPGFSTSSEESYPYKFADDYEHFLDGLRKAGWEG